MKKEGDDSIGSVEHRRGGKEKDEQRGREEVTRKRKRRKRKRKLT